MNTSSLSLNAVSSGAPSQHRRRLLLGSLACLSAPAWAASAGKPLPIPLAQEAAPDVDPAGHLVSEKHDGVRAVWNGRELRFRSGLLISAPAWFLQRLPAAPLDGELWFGRGRFENLSGAVRRKQPDDDEWRQIRYMAFDLPAASGGFAQRHQQLDQLTRQHGFPALQAVAQRQVNSRQALQRWLDEVVAAGGEGLVLRRQDAAYGAGRTTDMLKLKPLSDAEAVVVAIEPGRGRFEGAMGALQVRTPQGKVFKIGTGFSDADRQRPPGPGERITYTYRGTTEDGVPRFASFLRLRPGGI